MSDGCLKNPQLETGTPVGKNRNQYMITETYINFCAYISVHVSVFLFDYGMYMINCMICW